MSKKHKVIETNLTMTGIMNFLIEKFGCKKSGNEFTLQDVQGYIRRGNLPKSYLGYGIKKKAHKYNKLYYLVDEK